MKIRHQLPLAIALFIFGLQITNHYKLTSNKSLTSNIMSDSTIVIVPSVEVTPTQTISNKPKRRGDLYAFMKKLGGVEGLGSYHTISKSGYLGLYQFHPKTLRSLGFNVSTDEFLANPVLQDSAMISYMRMNAKELRSIINKFSGTTTNGVYVTKAGILAGAHLVGSAGVFAFFYPDKYSYRTVDGNGVHVRDYMKKFAGYDLRGL